MLLSIYLCNTSAQLTLPLSHFTTHLSTPFQAPTTSASWTHPPLAHTRTWATCITNSFSFCCISKTFAGTHYLGQLDTHPPLAHTRTWATSISPRAHGPRTCTQPTPPAYYSSATPYTPWVLVPQPQASGWRGLHRLAQMPVTGEEMLELPAWACSTDDEEVVGLQVRILEVLVA